MLKMVTTVKVLSEQMMQFQNLMMASNEKIQAAIAEVKKEVSQLSLELKGVKELASRAEKIAVNNKEQISQLNY